MDELYRSIFDESPDAQVVVDEHGTIERVNARAEELFGYVERDLVGREIETLVPARLRALHREHRTGHFEAASVGCVRPLVYGLRSDGEECAVGINLNTLFTADGPRTIAMVRNIDVWASALDTQAAFDEAPIAMALASITHDGDRVIRSANRALAELVGRTREDLVGLSFRDLTHPGDAAESEQAVIEILQGRQSMFSGRKRYRHADGHDVWVEVHASPIESGGTERLALVHVLDVGARVELERQQRREAGELEAEVSRRTEAHAQAEQRLRVSLAAERDLLEESQDQQQRLDVSLRAAAMGTCELNFETGLVRADDRAAEVLGITGGSITNDELLELVHRDDRERVAEAVRSALDEIATYDVVFRIELAHDPGVRWVRGWGQPVEDESGAVRKIVGVVQDVSDERAALQLLKNREARSQLVLDVTVTGVFDWDLVEESIIFSDHWFESIGFNDGDIETQPWDWRTIIHPNDWPAMAHRVEALVVGTDLTFTHDARLSCQDGTWRWARLAARVAERDAAGRAQRIIGAETDISDQRTLEQQLVHSAKMHSLGEFAGGIAHDFNNVMAVVRGHTEFLLRDHADPDDAVRRLTAIDRAIDRSSSLVRELMLLSRPATDNPVVMDLRAHVETTSASWPALLGDDVLLELDLPDGEAPDGEVLVRIDASRLDALLLNIAANARDAMPHGGSLSVVLSKVIDDDGTECARIELTDDGIGMDPGTLDSLFEPFFTTKAPGVGTGLGLATSLTTASQAGGTITARSSVGVGTTITVTLPLADSGTLWTPDPEPDRTAASVVGTVLVVEDQAELLQLTADTLRLAGHRVYEALDGAEAIDILEQREGIDLMITDAVMPGLSGPQLVAIVKERWPRVKSLYLSGYAAASPAIEAVDISKLLTKPISSEDLLAAIEAELQAGD